MHYLEVLNFKQLAKKHKPKPEQDKREFYTTLQARAEKGPLYSKALINKIKGIPLDLNKDEIRFTSNYLQKYKKVDVDELRYIIDWSRAKHKTISDMDYSEALANSYSWHQSLIVGSEPTGKYKTKEVVFTFPNLWTIVKITESEDLRVEGNLMGHCVGGYSSYVKNGTSEIYSLRDISNNPHVTIEVKKNKVAQIQGKQNKKPIMKYMELLFVWLKNTTFSKNWVSYFADKEFKKSVYKDQLEELIYYLPKNIFDRIHSAKDKKEIDLLLETRDLFYTCDLYYKFPKTANTIFTFIDKLYGSRLKRIRQIIKKENPEAYLSFIDYLSDKDILTKFSINLAEQYPKLFLSAVKQIGLDNVGESTLLNYLNIVKKDPNLFIFKKLYKITTYYVNKCIVVMKNPPYRKIFDFLLHQKDMYSSYDFYRRYHAFLSKKQTHKLLKMGGNIYSIADSIKLSGFKRIPSYIKDYRVLEQILLKCPHLLDKKHLNILLKNSEFSILLSYYLSLDIDFPYKELLLQHLLKHLSLTIIKDYYIKKHITTLMVKHTDAVIEALLNSRNYNFLVSKFSRFNAKQRNLIISHIAKNIPTHTSACKNAKFILNLRSTSKKNRLLLESALNEDIQQKQATFNLQAC